MCSNDGALDRHLLTHKISRIFERHYIITRAGGPHQRF
jgi:hypothetical protein